MKNEQEQKSKRLPGFYIALCCCVLAIGIAGYFSERAAKKDVDTESVFTASTLSPDIARTDEDSAPTFSGAKETVPPATEAPKSEETINIEPAVEDYAVDNPDVESAAVIVSAEEPYFAMPAGGAILEGFTTSLAYNSATGDYRTHNGVDIAADEGCSVCASADGTVEEISADEMGQNITISHQNGMATKYMSLGSVEDLSVGDSVKAGDVVGTVGAPKGENTSQAHLHFEMYSANTPVDPCKYLN
ncbi:MAG: M23 family metallopeptidase [Clostridiales bacterium]|nr:M23 family metallopeptidase [Clostridiales bacterium]